MTTRHNNTDIITKAIQENWGENFNGLTAKEKKALIKAQAKLSPEIYKQFLCPLGYQGSTRTNLIDEKLSDSTNPSFYTFKNGRLQRHRSKNDNKARLFAAAGMWVTDRGDNSYNYYAEEKIRRRLNDAKESFLNTLNDSEKTKFKEASFNLIYCSLLSEGYSAEKQLHTAISNSKLEVINIKCLYAPAAITRYINSDLIKFKLRTFFETVANTYRARKKLINTAKDIISKINAVSEEIGNKDVQQILNKKRPTEKDLKKITTLDGISETYRQVIASAVAAKIFINKLGFNKGFDNGYISALYVISKAILNLITYPLRAILNGTILTQLFLNLFRSSGDKVKYSPYAFSQNINLVTLSKKLPKIILAISLISLAPLVASYALWLSIAFYGLAFLILIDAIFKVEKHTNDHLSLMALITLMNPASQTGCKTARDRTGLFFALTARVADSLAKGKTPSYDLNQNMSQTIEDNLKAMIDLGQHPALKYGGPSCLVLHKKKTLANILITIFIITAITVPVFLLLAPSLTPAFIFPLIIAGLTPLVILKANLKKATCWFSFVISSVPLAITLATTTPALTLAFVLPCILSIIMFIIFLLSLRTTRIDKKLIELDVLNKGSVPAWKKSELRQDFFNLEINGYAFKADDEKSKIVFRNGLIYYRSIDGTYRYDLTRLYEKRNILGLSETDIEKIESEFKNQLAAIEEHLSIPENINASLKNHSGEIIVYVKYAKELLDSKSTESKKPLTDSKRLGIINYYKAILEIFSLQTELSKNQSAEEIEKQISLDSKRIGANNPDEFIKKLNLQIKHFKSYDQGQLFLSDELEKLIGLFEDKIVSYQVALSSGNTISQDEVRILLNEQNYKKYLPYYNTKEKKLEAFSAIRLDDFLRYAIVLNPNTPSINTDELYKASHIVILCKDTTLSNRSQEREQAVTYKLIMNEDDLNFEGMPEEVRKTLLTHISEFNLACLNDNELTEIKNCGIKEINQKIDKLNLENATKVAENKKFDNQTNLSKAQLIDLVNKLGEGTLKNKLEVSLAAYDLLAQTNSQEDKQANDEGKAEENKPPQTISQERKDEAIIVYNAITMLEAKEIKDIYLKGINSNEDNKNLLSYLKQLLNPEITKSIDELRKNLSPKDLSRLKKHRDPNVFKIEERTNAEQPMMESKITNENPGKANKMTNIEELLDNTKYDYNITTVFVNKKNTTNKLIDVIRKKRQASGTDSTEPLIDSNSNEQKITITKKGKTISIEEFIRHTFDMAIALDLKKVTFNTELIKNHMKTVLSVISDTKYKGITLNNNLSPTPSKSFKSKKNINATTTNKDTTQTEPGTTKKFT